MADEETSRRGPGLAHETCLRHLRPLIDQSNLDLAVEYEISWHGPAAAGLGSIGSEATVQALSGLMEVHGWDGGRPRRLGLEVASVAAGLMAANGVLAAAIGARRDRPVARVETSVLQAAVWLVAHHVAAATAGGDLLPSPTGPAPGPPFRAADGRWFEIETFDAEEWKAFWLRLGAGDAPLGRAWTSFRSRYYRGRCSLPQGLHEATARHSLAELCRVADDCHVSLIPLRSYREVLDDPLWTSQPIPDPVGGSLTPSRRHPAALGSRPLPLAGVRLVEATNRMQGPLAGLLLQMLGADVVRVEPPGGDVGRMVPPACGEVGSFFLCYNRGKQAIELDLAHERGQNQLLELLRESDVFLHNWRPGTAAKWALDRTRVTSAIPRLVYAEATGWGESQLNRRTIGTDFLVQAYTGFGEGLNPVGEAPTTSRALLTDCLGGLVTCQAILRGLYTREATGRSTAVVSSLLEGAMAAQHHVLAGLSAGHETGRRDGRPVWGPLDYPLDAKGGAVVVAIGSDRERAALAELCRVSSVNVSPDKIDRALIRCVGQNPPAHWEERLREVGIPCAAVTEDLAMLPTQPELGCLFEPLGGSCHAPASPWEIRW